MHMVKVLCSGLLVACMDCRAEIVDYNDLVERMIVACRAPSILLSDGFTNELVSYRAMQTNVWNQCVADIALSVAMMQRFDKHMDMEAYERHRQLSSNVFHSTLIPVDSWIHYAGAFEYVSGLNVGGEYEKGFEITTNQLRRLSEVSPDMGSTNYWMALMTFEGCTNATAEDIFKLNAAAEMLRQERQEEVGAYTNSLPETLIRQFNEELLQ